MKFFRKYYLPAAFFFFLGNLNAQNKQAAQELRRGIDSLKKGLINAAEDTSKMNTLVLLARQFSIAGETDSALTYAFKAIETADKFIPSSVKIISTAAKRAKSKACNSIGLIYNNQGKLKEAAEYLQLAISLAEETGDKKAMASACINSGLNNWRKGAYNAALKLFSTALILKKELGDKRGIAECNNSMAVMYGDQGNYPLSLQYHFAALRQREEIGEQQGIAGSHNNIGTIYSRQFNNDEALKHYLIALKIFEEINDKRGIAVSHNNVGTMYEARGEYIEALRQFEEGLKLRKEMGDLQGVAGSLNNIGRVWYLLQDLQKAKTNYSEGLKIQLEIGDKKGIAYSYNSMAQICAEEKKYKEAKSFFSKAKDMGIEIGYMEIVKDAYLNMAQLDSLDGNWKGSFENYKLAVAYQDSMINEENTKKSIQSEMQYDFDKKSAADSVKNSEAKKFEEVKHQHEISKQKIFTYGGVIGFLVMIVVAGISYNAFRNKKKANIEIQHQKHLVEEKQKEILDSIYYARRIQRALITNEKYIERNLNRINKRI